MTKAGERIIEGAKEALAIARGEQPAPRLHLNGHAYVPEEVFESLRSELEAVKRERDGALESARKNLMAGHDFKAELEAVKREAVDETHAFKNFHRLLCERFNYTHDEKDWKRDQLSLIEWIAALSAKLAEAERAELIADAVIIWLVQHRALDADQEYYPTDIVNALNDIVAEPSPDARTHLRSVCEAYHEATPQHLFDRHLDARAVIDAELWLAGEAERQRDKSLEVYDEEDAQNDRS
jgi:hypothetical protein